jgi:hypothetical protein
MWILNFLPDWIFHLIVLAGLAGLVLSTFLLKWIPLVSQYKLPVQIGSIVALIVGIWFEGGISNEHKWLERVAELEAKIAVAEAQSKQENVKIVEKVVKKTEYITRRGQDIVQYVDREIVKYDEKFKPGGVCEIPKEFIKAHNDAAEQPK